MFYSFLIAIETEECPSTTATPVTTPVTTTTTTITLSPSSLTPSPLPLPDPSLSTTTNTAEEGTGALSLATKPYRNPKPETTEAEEPTTPISEVVTSNIPPMNLVSPGLTTDKIIGIAFGSLAVLVLLVAIKMVFTIVVVSHCRQRRRDKGEKVIHALIDATLSYNYNYARGEIVLLSKYSNTERISGDYNYATPQSSTASLNLTESHLSTPPAHDGTSTCYYVQPNKNASYDQLRGPHYKQPRTPDHYDQPNRLHGPETLHGSSPPQMLVVPYAIGNASLRSTLSRERADQSTHGSNDYVARNGDFNVVTNEAYAMNDRESL